MICVAHARLLVIVAASILFGGGTSVAQTPATIQTRIAQQTVVTVRWGTRPGVSRYRLQLANDRDFADIVFDRVVRGHEYQVSDLLPGKYFWRVASLDGKLGTFSSAGVIEVTQAAAPAPSAAATATKNVSSTTTASTATTRNSWYAALADVSKPLPAHLRSAKNTEIVATTNDNRVIAIDGLTGVALWIRQLSAKPASTPVAVVIRDRSGLDDVFVVSGTAAFVFDGATGRDLWHGSLPGEVSMAVASGDRVFAIENSLQRGFLINASTAKLISDVRLTSRLVGVPVFTNAFGSLSVVVALEDGHLQVFDESGKLTRTGDAAAVATTGPLFVRTPRAQLFLVGTRNGLTALNAEDLRPLGRTQRLAQRISLRARPR